LPPGPKLKTKKIVVIKKRTPAPFGKVRATHNATTSTNHEEAHTIVSDTVLLSMMLEEIPRIATDAASIRKPLE
jgi:hypothetical protein